MLLLSTKPLNVPFKKICHSLFLLLLLGFIWGSGYSLAKYAMTNGVPPLGYSFWQAAGPACLLVFFSLSQSGRLLWQWKYWWFYATCGLIGIAIPNTNMYFIADKLPAGVLAMLVNTVPLLVYPLALLFRQEILDGGRVLAVCLGCIGIVIIINPMHSNLLSQWSLMALISPLAFALCAVFIAVKQPASMRPLPAACGMLICASLLISPLVWQQKAFYAFSWPLNTAQQVVILEIFLSTFGYLIFFRLIQLAGPVFYSLTGTIVALTGLFWGYLLLGETLDLSEITGITCIVCAILLITWKQFSQPTRERL